MSLLQPLVRTARTRVTRAIHLAPRRSVHVSHTTPRLRPTSATLLWGAGLTISTGVFVFFKLQPTIHLDSELSPNQVHDNTETIMDPATSIEFPTSIRIPSKINTPTMTLLGVGVRAVTVLRVKVYSIGFYADLENPNLKISPDMSPEEKIEHIVQNCACVVRIVPTRTTSYTHLRDAFMRALQQRMGEAKQKNILSEEEAQAVGSPMRKLKTLFPNTPIVKNTPLDIYLPAPIPGRSRPLIFRDLGAVESDWVARELILHYLEGITSPPLKKMVADRLESFEK